MTSTKMNLLTQNLYMCYSVCLLLDPPEEANFRPHETLYSAMEQPVGVGHHGLVQTEHYPTDIVLQRYLGVLKAFDDLPLTNAPQKVTTRIAVC